MRCRRKQTWLYWVLWSLKTVFQSTLSRLSESVYDGRVKKYTNETPASPALPSPRTPTAPSPSTVGHSLIVSKFPGTESYLAPWTYNQTSNKVCIH